MRGFPLLCLAGGIAALVSQPCMAATAEVGAVESYNGICEASAAAALDDTHFVVASDERNELYVYERGKPDPHEVPSLLSSKKSDIEAAAKIGSRIYWLSSHSVKKNKTDDPKRRVFYAAEVTQTGQVFDLKMVGEAPMDLRPDLPGYTASWNDLINIEGMAATDQGTLLIGFRSPTLNHHALVVELTNPAAVVDKAETPQFSGYQALDLGRLGIRSLERFATGDLSYLIAAGPSTDETGFALYSWGGVGTTPVDLHAALPDTFRPEAMIVTGPDRIQLLSDDGDAVSGDGAKCSDDEDEDPPAGGRRFRSVEVVIKP